MILRVRPRCISIPNGNGVICHVLKSISFKNDLRNSEATKIYLILPRYFVYKKYQHLVRSTSKDKETQIKKYFLATPTPLSRPPPLKTPKILILQSFKHEFAHF